MSRPIRWCFLAEPPRLTRGETPRLIPPQDEKSGALGLFCKWLVGVKNILHAVPAAGQARAAGRNFSQRGGGQPDEQREFY